MSTPTISAQQARHDVEVSDAVLVCAYDSDEKFAANHLQHAISLAELRARQDELSKQRELIFYCA